MLLNGSIVALVTPFGRDGAQSVHFDRLAELLALQAKHGARIVVPCGSTGESATLSHPEHDAVIAFAGRQCETLGLKVLAGTGSNSTAEAVKLTANAAKAGAAGCLVVTPYYNRPSPAGLLRHYRELNEIGIPLVLYNIPSRTGRAVSVDETVRIWDQCSNVVGLKAGFTDLAEIMAIIARTRDPVRPLQVLAGDDAVTLPVLASGGTGVISVAANIAPGLLHAIVNAFSAGRLAEAQRFSWLLEPFATKLLRYGTNPEAIKSLMCNVGIDVGECRLPLATIESTQVAELAALLRTFPAEMLLTSKGGD